MKAGNTMMLLAATCMLAWCCNKIDKPQEDGQEEVTTLAVPSGLALVGNPGENSLEFSWNAVEGAKEYAWRAVKGMTVVKEGKSSSTQAKAEGLEEATTYKLSVKAIAGSVSSAYSSALEATTAKSQSQDNPTDPGSAGSADEIYAKMLIPACEEDGKARAFPGAEGGGMWTTGGRGGGKVYHVTNLDNDGEGSLRYGIEKAERPCTIVFDVAGTIKLKSPLVIKKGDLTIAGQTAPGDGICIRDRYTNISADNVIIRFLRFRLGDEGSGAGDSDDCIWGRYRKNVIIDHCSMSWSIDEVASFYANSNFTMQWCIMSESMKNCSIHTKGNHGYGGIWGGENASFHHNILAHNDSRNPRFDHPHIYENHTNPSNRGVVDFRCNVVYDWGSNNSYGGEGYGAGKGIGINMLSNFYKPGPSSTDRKYFMDSYAVYSKCSDGCNQSNIEEGYPLLHISGNTHTKYSELTSDNSKGIYWHNGESHANYGKTAASAFAVKGPEGQSCYTTTQNATDALTIDCRHAGASLRRDKVDERIVSEVKSGTGKIIDDIAMVKSLYGQAWPEYKADEEQLAIASKDTDGDGIPDWYESLLGLDKNKASDAAEFTLDKHKRYNNLEMYLHWLVKDIVAAQAEGGKYMEQ